MVMRKCPMMHRQSSLHWVGANAPATESERTLCQTRICETGKTRERCQAKAETKRTYLKVVDR